MTRLLFSVLIFIIVGTNPARSQDLPPKATYLFYIQGIYAGKCAVDISTDNDILIFASESEVEYQEYNHKLTCRTEIEKESLRPRFFRYKGVRNGDTISGTIWVEGDSIAADLEFKGDHFASGSKLADPTFLFQNYISDHQIVMLRGVAASESPFMRFSVLFPSDFMPAAGLATIDSEIELPSVPDPTVCEKYAISIQNSSVYFLYLDTKRNIPIYMDFPATETEVFLEGLFGDAPLTKYVAPEKPEE